MSFRLENNREELYQWDSNQRLIIEDAAITHIHYCNRTDAEALVVRVYQDGAIRVADIPNILLQDVWNICVYAYADGCYTKQSKIIKVIKRSRPASYMYEETEILKWERLQLDMENYTDEEVRKVSSDLSQYKENTNLAMGIMVDDYAKIAGEVKGLQSDVSTLQGNVSTLQSDVATLKTETAKIPVVEAEMKEAMAALDAEITEDMTTLDAEIKAEMATLEGRVNTEISNVRHEFGNNYANAIQKTEKEKVAIGINDVSPAPHYVSIDTVANGKVVVGGKNLIDYTKAQAYRGSLEIIDGGVRWKAGGTYYFSIPCSLPKGTTVSASFNHNGTGTDVINNMRVKYVGGANDIAPIYDGGLTLTADAEAIYIYKNSVGTALTKDVDITNIQLEIGTKATTYEKYEEPTTYTADAKGHIDIASRYPSMSFVSVKNGETAPNISIKYNRDLNAVINELTAAIISLGGNV